MLVNQFRRIGATLCFCLATLTCTGLSVAQQGNNDLLRDDYINFFTRTRYLDEMEIVSDQRIQINQKIQDFQTRMRKSAEQGKRLDIRAERRKTLNEIISDILLPHQKERFVQLAIREKVSTSLGSFAGFLEGSGDSLLKSRDAAGLSPAQKESLVEITNKTKERLSDASKAYLEKIDKILSEEKQAAKMVLTPEQKEVVDSIFGDNFAEMSVGEEFAGRIFQLYLMGIKRERKSEREIN